MYFSDKIIKKKGEIKNKIMDDKNYQRKKMSVKKIILVVVTTIIIICAITLAVLYFANENFRKWTDIKVFRKDITEQDIVSIDLNTDKNNQIFCYNKYIGILNDRILNLYNQSGQKLSEITVDINSAIFTSNNKYLAIAEKEGQEFCVIFDKTYLWRARIEGQILQIHINKNGYVALITTDNTYKSIITVFDSSGQEILKNYLSSTRVVDASISDDNKNVAFAELDTSGTLIQSNIKVISIEKAKKDAENAIVYSYQADSSKMIVSIEYQDKQKLVCVYDNSVDIISGENNQEILSVDKKMTFISGELKNSVVYISEEQSGLFNSTSTATIIDTSSNRKSVYNFDEVAKEMYTCEDIIGINVGSEMYFINTSGMLLKKYTSKQEITNVLLSSNLGIIIYKDRIEIVNL